MKTYQELKNEYSTLIAGDTIFLDNDNYQVIENRLNDNIFLANIKDDRKMFHIFYDELNPETDDFIKL